MTSPYYQWSHPIWPDLSQDLTNVMKTKTEPPTNEQKAQIKEMMTTWAKERLADPKTLILDVETTGFLSKDPEAEVVSVSMINTANQVVLASLVNPGKPIPMAAQKIHQINDQAVKDSPPFSVIGQLIAGLMEGKHVVAFNAGFDIHMIVTLMQRYGIDIPDFETSCAMEAYSAWVGDWSKTKQDWKWQKLPKLAFGNAHDALVDCQSTLLLLKKMSGDFSDEPNPNDISLDF